MSSTEFRIFENVPPYRAVITFMDGNKFKQRGDYIQPDSQKQLHDLMIWLKKYQFSKAHRIMSIELFDNTKTFQESRVLKITRSIDSGTGEIKGFKIWQDLIGYGNLI